MEKGHQNEQKHEVPEKEGTLKAYLALLAGSLGLFISLGWVNCIALFQAQYEDNQLKDHSPSDVSWITSTEFFLMLFLSPVSGYLFDNFGPRVPIFIGGLLQVFGLMMTSLSTKYYQILLSQSIVAGSGTSLLMNPCMTAPMTYFRKRRALAGGLVVAGSSLGGVVFPLMVGNLLPQIGFAWTMRACAFFTLGLWAFVLLMISVNSRAHELPISIRDFQGNVYINGVQPDKYGRFNVMIVMVLFTSIIDMAVWLPGKSNTAIIVFAILFGVGQGACIGLLPVLSMNLSPSPSEIGFRLGAALAVAGIASLTGPPIAGAIAASSGGLYDNSFIFAGVSGVVSTAFMGLLRGRVVGWSILAKETYK
ncbi:hypothetical protein FE257_001805 [Aspergillus nanangensis]|uniref:Major facilitator superfamily (MFS) profile domain-containing protein n=1 Tax=Aspergillus nanangensis TaxID=2582783 RepID=A0AAD4CDE5_ASPNN|nr:hypothetical protein FE257_001805 [Aspergillus nanangensis]